MVHALNEIWRVLAPGQSLIDLRPLAGESRVEVIAGQEVLFAGLVDESGDKLDDEAADRAIAQVMAFGKFKQVHQTIFDFSTYWDTPDEMKTYGEARWTKARLPEAVLVKARQLMIDSNSVARVRIRRKLLIARYQKIGN